MNAWIGAIALTGSLVSTGALADGNALLEHCQQVMRVVDAESSKNTNPVGAGQCLGMLEGVRSTMTILHTALPENYRICFPKNGISNGQAARIVIKFLEDNPAILNQDATFLSLLAFKEAYPCK